MKNNNSKKFFFIDIHKKVESSYEETFINCENKKLYWFGVGCLPLIYFVTISIYTEILKDKFKIKKLNEYYKEKISYDVFKKSIIKQLLKRSYFFFLKLLFIFKKKIFVVYSDNDFTSRFCKNKNYFKIKIDPLWFFKLSEINQIKLDKIFIQKIDLFLNRLIKIFLISLNKNRKNKVKKKIKDKFIYYYKVYLVMASNAKKYKNQNFITSYTGVIYVRLFLSALRYNNNCKIFTLTHGEVEILNQKPSLQNDPCLLANHLIFKGLNFKKKYKNYFSIINKNYKKPKLIGFKDNEELNDIKKNYLYNRKDNKKVLVVGYPRSHHFNINFPQISSIDYYKVEIELMKKLKSLGYDVTYKIHPDRIEGNIELFKNFQVLHDRYENVEKEFKYTIFTYHRSTALGNALKNNSSILLLYYKKLDMDDYTFKSLSNRISFVQLNYVKNKILLKTSNLELNELIKKSNKLVNYKSIIKMIM